MTHLPPSPFIFDPDHRFIFNETEFMEAIERLPPSVPDAAEIEPLIRILAERNQ